MWTHKAITKKASVWKWTTPARIDTGASEWPGGSAGHAHTHRGSKQTPLVFADPHLEARFQLDGRLVVLEDIPDTEVVVRRRPW